MTNENIERFCPETPHRIPQLLKSSPLDLALRRACSFGNNSPELQIMRLCECAQHQESERKRPVLHLDK